MKTGRIRKKCFQQRLVVATQTYGASLSNAPRQRLDHVFRLRTTIDVIADINLNNMCDRAAYNIILDPLYHIVQEIGPTMNIPNGINSGTGRKSRF